MKIEIIASMITNSIPDSKVEVKDLNGNGDHFSALVISKTFNDLSLIQRHKKVYDSLSAVITKELHALQLTTLSLDEWLKNNE